MLSVVVPTLNEHVRLAGTLRSLNSDTAWPVDVVVSDGGSTDGTQDLARKFGAQVVSGAKGRGRQLAAGAAAAEGDWLFFLHADTVLSDDWPKEFDHFIQNPDNARRAAYCQFALDDSSGQARSLERRVAWRSRRLGLPFGDQGLLISRQFYHDLGGHKSMPLFEDVDLVRRIGKRRLDPLPVRAVTSADRYRRSGYRLRSARNACLLILYYLRVPPGLLARIY